MDKQNLPSFHQCVWNNFSPVSRKKVSDNKLTCLYRRVNLSPRVNLSSKTCHRRQLTCGDKLTRQVLCQFIARDKLTRCDKLTRYRWFLVNTVSMWPFGWLHAKLHRHLYCFWYALWEDDQWAQCTSRYIGVSFILNLPNRFRLIDA